MFQHSLMYHLLVAYYVTIVDHNRYASMSSKEGSKVLNQLIEALLNPVEDVQRYICVLEHLCWLADELGESEIICPIVEYATQLQPQLQRALRISKLSLRDEPVAGGHSSSDSEDIKSGSSAGGPARGVQAPASSGKSQKSALVQTQSSRKINISSLIKSMDEELDNRPSDDAFTSTQNATPKKTAKAAVLAVMASASMQRDSAMRSRSQLETTEFELERIQSAGFSIEEMQDAGFSIEVAADDKATELEASGVAVSV